MVYKTKCAACTFVECLPPNVSIVRLQCFYLWVALRSPIRGVMGASPPRDQGPWHICSHGHMFEMCGPGHWPYSNPCHSSPKKGRHPTPLWTGAGLGGAVGCSQPETRKSTINVSIFKEYHIFYPRDVAGCALFLARNLWFTKQNAQRALSWNVSHQTFPL
jgi:hypothetical protein